jgi:hypothetical protein
MTRRATEKNAGEMAGAISGMRGRTPLMPAKIFK